MRFGSVAMGGLSLGGAVRMMGQFLSGSTTSVNRAPCPAPEPDLPPPRPRSTKPNGGRGRGAGEGAGDVDPVGGEVGADEVGSEGAGRVHGGAGDRAAPQSGQGDVAADAEGADDPDVLRARRGAEDHADESEREDELHPERGHVRVAGGGVVRAVHGRHVDDVLEEQAGKGGAEELHDDVAGDAPPREVTAQRERDADRGVQVGTGDLAHEQDDGHHHQGGGDDGGLSADGVGEGLAHHAATGGDEHEEEGAERFGEEAAPFLVRVVEVVHWFEDTGLEPVREPRTAWLHVGHVILPSVQGLR